MGLFNFGSPVTDFCTNMAPVIKVIGIILLVVKIAIPLLIIALGIFDLGKAVVADKEDEIKKSTKRLLYRVIAGVAIFLLPNIIMFLFMTFATAGGTTTTGTTSSTVTAKDAGESYSDSRKDFSVCEGCFLHPTNSIYCNY